MNHREIRERLRLRRSRGGPTARELNLEQALVHRHRRLRRALASRGRYHRAALVRRGRVLRFLRERNPEGTVRPLSGGTVNE